MKISIVTVCFNSEKTIRDTIESVLAQDYKNVEYIIVDGASTDRTMEIVRGYGDRIATIVSEKDKGIYDAMNKGVRIATGDVLGILNSDDFYEADTVLSSVVAAFNINPSPDIVFGDVVLVSPQDVSRVRRHYSASHFRRWKLRYGWMPPHPATFVKKELYLRYGFYDLGFRISADYEMFVRWLLVHRAHFLWIDRVLVRMRMGGVSNSGIKSSILLNREIVRACRQHGFYTNLFLVLTKIPFKLMELLKRPT